MGTDKLSRDTDIRRDHLMLIGGSRTASDSGRTIICTDPYTGDEWAEAPDASVDDVDRAVLAARQAFSHGDWATMLPAQRAQLLRRLGDLIAANADMLAFLQVRENGKLLREMLPGVPGIAAHCYYAAGLAEQVHGLTLPVSQPNMMAYTVREPLGVVAAITPWNSPLNLLIWKVAPALAVGNTMVIKPSEISPISTLAFAELFAEAGFPAGVINVVTGGGATGQALVEHPGVDKIAFTGSTNAGRNIAQQAGRRLARVSLELGGKSPNIVFGDADFNNAVNGVLGGIFGAGGQTCIAGSRVLIHEDIYEKFCAALVDRAQRIRLGDPLAPETQMGPVACRAQYDRVVAYLRDAQADGAQFLCGGPPTGDDNGLFIRPTILDAARSNLAIARQEVFGPVACTFRFKDEREAIQIANDTEFGLGAGIWTSDLATAHRVARQVRAGTVWVNNYRKVSYVAPFGGFKSSGLGRENGLESINEFTEVKTVWIDTGNSIADPFNPFA